MGADWGASHAGGAVCGGCGETAGTGQRRWRGHNRHRGDEPIPLPMHGRNVLWRPGHVAEHVANFTDTGGEHPVADMHVRPDGRQEVGFAHQAAGVGNQIAQDGLGFGREFAPLRAAPEAVVRAIEGKRAKVQGRDGRHRTSQADAVAIAMSRDSVLYS